MKFFNTAFSLSMVNGDCNIGCKNLTIGEAKKFLAQNGVKNVANPTHANTISAVSAILKQDLGTTKGERVSLSNGDSVLVAQVVFPPSVPRETVEYTDEQLALGKFDFKLVTINQFE